MRDRSRHVRTEWTNSEREMGFLFEIGSHRVIEEPRQTLLYQHPGYEPIGTRD